MVRSVALALWFSGQGICGGPGLSSHPVPEVLYPLDSPLTLSIAEPGVRLRWDFVPGASPYWEGSAALSLRLDDPSGQRALVRVNLSDCDEVALAPELELFSDAPASEPFRDLAFTGLFDDCPGQRPCPDAVCADLALLDGDNVTVGAAIALNAFDIAAGISVLDAPPDPPRWP